MSAHRLRAARRRYDTGAFLSDLSGALLGLGLVGVLTGAWQVTVLAAGALAYVAGVALLVLGIGGAAGRKMPNEVDR